MTRRKRKATRAEREAKERVDELLAAPDSVRKDERERRKVAERKAREEAAKARLLASKSKTPPTIEDLLADIVRVADDEATNPFHEFRSISRRRYELYGRFPVEFVDRQFGQFQHALEVAGLRPQEGTRLWMRKRAEESRRDHAERYIDRYVRPYVVSAEEHRRLQSPYLLLSISDLHAHYLCPFVWRAFLSAIRDLQPDGVLLNGDIIDGSELSRYPKIRGRTLRLKDELAFQRTMFAQIRAVHDGALFATCGNHDLADRLPRYLATVDPVISDIDDRRVDELMGLGEFDVQLFYGGSTKSPRGTEYAKSGLMLFGFYRAHHGSYLGRDAAHRELAAAGWSGQSGHLHHSSLVFGTSERDEGKSWMISPMAARHEVGGYLRRPNTAWQKGMAVAWLFPNRSVHQYPCVVSGSPERIMVEGHIYERGPDCVDPDPYGGNWLEGIK